MCTLSAKQATASSGIYHLTEICTLKLSTLYSRFNPQLSGRRDTAKQLTHEYFVEHTFRGCFLATRNGLVKASGTNETRA